jgi:hypothetical protein
MKELSICPFENLFERAKGGFHDDRYGMLTGQGLIEMQETYEPMQQH